MAHRKVYADDAGELYFKGEGFSFYLPRPNTTSFKEGDKVEVISVSCGQTGASASYVDAKGRTRFAASE